MLQDNSDAALDSADAVHVDEQDTATTYTRSVDEVEQELACLAGHLNAGVYRWLMLVHEFDARRGWARAGCNSCADWLGWKCGVAPNTAREQVRVAGALHKLPQTESAFARGEVSYSKVRAITRVATAENESHLLQYARHGTAAHVETLVRLYRRQCERDSCAAHTAQHRARTVQWYSADDGTLVLKAALPPELGAVVVRAIETSVDALYEAHTPAPGARVADGAEHDSEAEPMAARRADALLHIAETFLEHVPTDTARTDDRYQVVVHVSAESLAEASGVESGVGSADDPSAATTCNANGGCAAHPNQPASVAPQAGGLCHLEHGPALPAHTARRLACDASVVKLHGGEPSALRREPGEVLNVGRKTRQIAPALRRALRARDGHCRFPGCSSRRWVEGHHLRHWAHGGETRLSNLVSVCRMHHRLVHEAGYTIALGEDGYTYVTTPSGAIITEQAPALIAGSVSQLESTNAADGVSIDVRTAVSRWGGESPDYSVTLDVMASRDRKGAGCRPNH